MPLDTLDTCLNLASQVWKTQLFPKRPLEFVVYQNAGPSAEKVG